MCFHTDFKFDMLLIVIGKSMQTANYFVTSLYFNELGIAILRRIAFHGVTQPSQGVVVGFNQTNLVA